MKSNWWKVGIVSVLAVGLLVVVGATQQEIKNPNTIIEVTIGDIETMDPAWHYDTASAQLILNVYETLIFYDREKLDKFIPQLATMVPSRENGLIFIGPDKATYITFPIRKGVKFQMGCEEPTPGCGELTPEDVAYTIQRGLLQDRSGGPQWVLLEPLLGVSSIEELVEKLMEEQGLSQEEADLEACRLVKRAVVADPETWTVTFRLVEPFMPILQIIAGGWGVVLDKEWVIEQGGWDGTCENWRKWHDPAAEEDELFNIANGTGPYKVERWTPGEEYVLVRNENYWRGTPECQRIYGPEAPKVCTGLAPIERVVVKVVPEWSDRFLMLQAGDTDFIAVPRQFVAQVDPLVEAGQVRMTKDLLTVVAADGFFTFDINVEGGNPYVGSGQLDGNGIPPNFFSDIHVRKAFNYSFDWDTYIQDIYLGEAEQRRGPIINGVLGYNPEQPTYSYDPEKAEEEFKLAWDGQVWEKGFRMTCLYNTGNEARKAACEMLEANIEALNPKFNIEVLDLPWPTYLKELVRSRMPMFFIGWIEDYHDPHNWAHPYLYSAGTFAGFQHFDVVKDVSYTFKYIPELVGQTKTYATLQDLFDELIDMARVELDTERRAKIYFDLQNAAYEFAPDLFLVQPLGRHYEQPWVQGWFYNPAYFGFYFYWYWKALPETVEVGPGAEVSLEIPEGATGFWIHNLGPGDVELWVNGERVTFYAPIPAIVADKLCGDPYAVCSIWSKSGWTAGPITSVVLKAGEEGATLEYSFYVP